MQARLTGTPDHILLAGGGAMALERFLRARIGRSKVLCDPESGTWLTALGMAVMMEAAWISKVNDAHECIMRLCRVQSSRQSLSGYFRNPWYEAETAVDLLESGEVSRV